MRLGGKSRECGTPGGSIKVPREWGGLGYPQGRIITARQMTRPLENDARSSGGAVVHSGERKENPPLKSSLSV